MSSLPVSRRDFCRSALAASSLVAAGFPPRALAQGGRTLTNVRVSHDGNDDHGEPGLVVNPRDPRNLLAACALQNGPPATYSSFDAGRTWRSNGPLPLTADIEGGGDLTIGFDGAGRAFVCALVSPPLSLAPKGTGFSVHVWHTDDGGHSFSPSVAASGRGILDHPSLAVERERPNAVHIVWSQAKGTDPAATATALKYTRSADGGQTFDAARTIARNAHGVGDAMIACGRSGSVYVVYHEGRNTGSPTRERTQQQPVEPPATVAVLRSQDRGRTFHRPVELGSTVTGIFLPATEASSLPTITADPDSGLVCAAFIRHNASVSGADILLAASRDGGRTWSRAKAVTPHDQIMYFEPQVAIDAAGRIGLMAFAMKHGKVSVVLMLSEPHSLRFGRPITITDRPFDPARSEFGRRWWIGDYQALATTPGFFHPLWNDTRTGRMQLFTAAVPARS